MRSFDNVSASPILVLPSSVPPHPFNMDPNPSDYTSHFITDFNPSPVASAPPSAAGRKRSRDEAGSNLEEDYFPVQNVESQIQNEDEWEYGEGMTLIKPRGSGYTISPGSGTGTWAEERAEEERAQAAAAQALERPMIRSAKSQRLDLTSTPSIVEEVMSNGTLVTPVAASPTNGYAEPTVDDFTRHLGVGWSLISADEGIQAAARGWTRYINNHFPVTNANIRLQSRGLSSYLVEADEGYFLFGEDLKHGRLVSRTLEQTFVNLRGSVPIFEGDEVLNLVESPRLNGGTITVAHDDNHDSGMKGVERANQAANGQTALEIDMDMS